MTASRFGKVRERCVDSTELVATVARSVGTTALEGPGADEEMPPAVTEHENRDTSVGELIDLADTGESEEPMSAQPGMEHIVIVVSGTTRTYDVTPEQKIRIMAGDNPWRSNLQQIANDDLALTSSSRRTSYVSVEDRPAGERYNA